MNALDEIRSSAQNGKLIIVTGAGVSLALASKRTPSCSWDGLVRSAFSFAQIKGKVEASQVARWEATLRSDDMDELLGAAEFVSRKLDAPNGLLFSRWLDEQFEGQTIGKTELRKVLQNLSRAGIPIATLNYDTLLEKVTGLPSIHMGEPRQVVEWSRRERPAILHLHGLWTAPRTIVLGTTDYTKATSDEFRANLQRALATFNRLLFIGCGETFADPNLSSLIDWARSTLGSAGLQHYALVLNKEVEERHKDKVWEGIVNPIGYGNQYSDLTHFVQNELTQSLVKPSRSKMSLPPEASVIGHYRKYLIRDCGQMTIEGVGADAETAKQKFDIEKLFVPLSVNAVPPEFSERDQNREKKLKEWIKKFGEPIPFGEALKQHQRLALLALPGGGKTLLLKRLEVAYADNSRRTITSDNLPELDVLPILIRCRDWRAHISLPLPSILNKFDEISGITELANMFQALHPRLKSGRVLLLIDGLDEIHNDAERTTFVDNLEVFLNEYSKVRLVVTSREAGFALVAPCLVRFCMRWKVAPLSEEAITLLCDHWHALMGGVSENTENEAAEVLKTILSSDSLQRLAENPLLLTMLLVVKHGFGRLPPDRVNLYDRAVEVLLDTWNIKGHSALNPREALPQLSYIAYRMMLQVKQTVTEQEILKLIEDCRSDIPLVRLYAQGSPSEFLGRVELRSSLLLEAGRQLDDGKVVKFYQFRHLTFQEYLAALAVVEGHYPAYREGDTALTPLQPLITLDEWKEVVPMAAVLARKQASALISCLVSLGEAEEQDFLSGAATDAKYKWGMAYRMPAPVARLVQCFVEEAEFSQANLMRSLRLAATFAHGCSGLENWRAILRGPFGNELSAEAWRLYSGGDMPKEAWLRNTTARFYAMRMTAEFWASLDGYRHLEVKLSSDDEEECGQAAAALCGAMWEGALEDALDVSARLIQLLPSLESRLLVKHRHNWEQVVWAIALLQSRQGEKGDPNFRLSTSALDHLVADWGKTEKISDSIVTFGVSSSLLARRSGWRPELSDRTKGRIRSIIESNAIQHGTNERSVAESAALLAYHGRLSINPQQILNILAEYRSRSLPKGLLFSIAADLGANEAEFRALMQSDGRPAPRR